MLARSGVAMFTQEVQDRCARISFRFGEKDLSVRQVDFIRQAIVYACVFGTDLLPDRASATSAILSWISSYKDGFDVLSFGEYLKAADSAIKHSLTDLAMPVPKGDLNTYERLKHSLSRFAEHIRHLAVIKPEVDAVCREGSTTAFSVCNSWINFLRRVNLPGLDLRKQMVDEYCALETEMESWVYDPDDVEALRAIISRWFADFDLTDFYPKHGPGAVATVEGSAPIVLKYELCRESDVRLRYIQKDIGPLESWLPWGSSYQVSQTEYGSHGLERSPLSRVSELICVPKSIITNRTISKEPAILQYFQQGYSEAMRGFIRKHRYLSRHIDFNSQDRSRRMAWEGSIAGEYATIDLSSASDTVTNVLVMGIFRDIKALLRGLFCTRSTATRLPGGKTLTLRKFAPMGSALCFPVETVVFSACCEYAQERTQAAEYDNADERPKRREDPHAKPLWWVFGDDIIVHVDLVPELLAILDRMHFKVNTSKSFAEPGLQGNFREACGIECLDGTDVTPLRLPRFFRGINEANMLDADAVTGACSLANNAFEYGARNLRWKILQDMGYRARGMLWDSTGTAGLRSDPQFCTNWRLKHRTIMARPGRTLHNVYQYAEFEAVVPCVERHCEDCVKQCDGFRWFHDHCEPCQQRKLWHTWIPDPRRSYGEEWVLLVYHPDFGEPDVDNRLQQAMEACRYHEWLKRHARGAESSADLRSSEPVIVCPMQPTLKRRWVYNPDVLPIGCERASARSWSPLFGWSE